MPAAPPDPVTGTVAPSTFLAPPDTPDVVYEFFGPFAHVPGRYEWCRVRSPTHGVFDLFIVLGKTTGVPATVYVDSDHGEAFMRDRYPECTTIRAREQGLQIEESVDGRTVTGLLAADAGPVRRASMRLEGEPAAVPRQEAYGATGGPVWGSRFTCWGVDLVVDARVHGFVEGDAGREDLEGAAGIVTLGSFGRIAPLPAK